MDRVRKSSRILTPAERRNIEGVLHNLVATLKVPKEVTHKPHLSRLLALRKMKAAEYANLDMFCFVAWADGLDGPQDFKILLTSYAWLIRLFNLEDDDFNWVDRRIDVEAIVRRFYWCYERFFTAQAVTWVVHQVRRSTIANTS